MLVLPAMLAAPNIPSAQAYCKSPWDCPDLDPTDNRSPVNPGNVKNTIQNNIDQTFKIYLKNNTSRPIWVAINSVLIPRGNFFVRGYWKIDPGERVYVADTPQRIVYFSAYDQYGKYWGDQNHTWKVPIDGKTRKFFEQNMGDSYKTFTQEFN